jgi:hypothetical protein
MAAAVEIPIRSRLDAKGFRDLDANLGKAKTSAVGLGKATANALGGGLGPAGELLSQITAISNAAEGMGTKLALGAGAIGIGITAVGLLVNKASDSVGNMTKALEVQKDALEDVNKQYDIYAKNIMKVGITAGSEDANLKMIKERVKWLKEENELTYEIQFGLDMGKKAPLRSEQERAQNLERIKTLEQSIADIESGRAKARGEQNRFNRNISPDALKLQESNALSETAKSVPLETAQALRDQVMESFNQGLANKTGGGAEQANAAQNTIEALDKLIAAIKEQNAPAAASLANSEQQIRDERLASNAAKDKLLQIVSDNFDRASPKQVDMTSGSIVSDARTRIGGSQNAPILSSWKTIADLSRQTAANTAATARNTAPRTVPTNPVSPAATAGITP